MSGDAMRSLIKRFVVDQCGATAIEYGLIAALIAHSTKTGQ
jgi:Flp pilus assembly pilin Flp